MKSQFLSLLGLFLCIQLASQSYIKIPTDSNYYWRQHSICDNYQYQIRYRKDTLIAGKVYNIYSPFGSSIGVRCTDRYLNVFLRQDSLNKKVFILNITGDQEYLLYDFSKTVGDTLLAFDLSINSLITYTVISVNGTIQELKNGNNPSSNFIQQGVGSLIGGLYGSQAPLNQQSAVEQLICFGKINPYSVIIPPNVGMESWCYLLPTGINNHTALEENLKVYPNPSNGKISIDFTDTQIINAIILNIFGQVVFSTENIKSKQEIDMSFLPVGIYNLKIESSSGQKNFKLVKE